jgi:hypothetical protein
MIPKTITFRGKRYQYHTHRSSKNAAENVAKTIRKTGKRATVHDTGAEFAVYTR